MLISHLFHFTVVFHLYASAKVTPVLAQSSVNSFLTVPVMFSIKSYSPVPQPHFTPTIGVSDLATCHGHPLMLIKEKRYLFPWMCNTQFKNNS